MCVYASGSDIADQVRSSAAEGVHKQGGENAGAPAGYFHCILFSGRSRENGHALLDFRETMSDGPVAGDAAMAAVENNDFISRTRVARECH